MNWYVEAVLAEVKVRSRVANDINFKRALRRQIEPKLDALAREVAALKEQLDRIERKFDVTEKQQEGIGRGGHNDG